MKTYPVDVTLTDKDENGNHPKETINVPFMSTDQLLEILKDKEVKQAIKDGTDDILIVLGQKLVKTLCPGVLERTIPTSGIEFMRIVIENEAESFGLGKTPPEDMKDLLISNATPSDPPGILSTI